MDQITSSFPAVVWPLALALLAMSAYLAVSGLRERDWLHPLVGPLLYVALVMIVPESYLQITRRGLGPMLVTNLVGTTVDAMALTVVAVLGGTLVGLIWRRRLSANPPTHARRTDWGQMRWIGRVLLILCAIVRAQYAFSHPASQYGKGQLSYSLAASIQSEADLALLAGLAIVVISNLQLSSRPLQLVDALALVTFALASVYTGSRLSIIGPLIFLIWAYHTHVIRLSLPAIITAVILGIALFLSIGLFRPSGHTTALGTDPVGRALVDISSPLYVTNEIVRHVPSTHPFLYGSTYVAAGKRQLPGPISNRLFGPPIDTGAYQFRLIERDFNANQGYSFALPAEGYLNFGLLGVIIAGLVTGMLFGSAWAQSQTKPERASQIVYPLLLAALPLGLRSDALTQSKLVITPLVATVVVFAICRRLSIRPSSLTESGFGNSPGVDTAAARPQADR